MKIKIITVIFSIFLSIGLFGQDHYDYTIKKPVGIASINEATTIAEQIVKAAGLKANFIIAEANVPNALAVLQQGKRYVLYNPGFVNRLTVATGTRWAAISVLAHEIGHHLYNSLTGKPDKTLATELEADQFSGYVLEKMGASLEEAQAAMNMLASPYATLTHPARTDRINSIASGWENAGGIMPEPETMPAEVVTTETLRSRDNRNDRIVFTPASFLARLYFNNDPDKDYYITNRLNIVKIENDEVLILGSVNQSSDENFPFIISGINGYRMYISSGGQIVNANGRIVGKVTKA
ncbi:MAG TPA: hypothetical protein VK483_14735 [Chitinophagaceae bacterium]|nr:hypothetical protein [Chitinophagaceae bacterium]